MEGGGGGWGGVGGDDVIALKNILSGYLMETFSAGN